jgi:hypothetical protein
MDNSIDNLLLTEYEIPGIKETPNPFEVDLTIL